MKTAKMGEKKGNLAGYFLPIESNEFYDMQKKSYSRLIDDEKILEEKLRKCDLEEFIHTVPGKMIPNVLTLGAVVYSIKSNSLLPLGIGALSEAVRIYLGKRFSKSKEQGLRNIEEHAKINNAASCHDERGGWLGRVFKLA